MFEKTNYNKYKFSLYYLSDFITLLNDQIVGLPKFLLNLHVAIEVINVNNSINNYMYIQDSIWGKYVHIYFESGQSNIYMYVYIYRCKKKNNADEQCSANH